MDGRMDGFPQKETHYKQAKETGKKETIKTKFKYLSSNFK
jgi:hypothetical protein